MNNNHEVVTQSSTKTLAELLQIHLDYTAKKEAYEKALHLLDRDLLENNSKIFKLVKKIKGQKVEVDGYELKIERAKEVIPAKTTYKYKSILLTVEKTYLLDIKWLRKVYNKYATETKKQIVKQANLLISKL